METILIFTIIVVLFLAILISTFLNKKNIFLNPLVIFFSVWLLIFVILLFDKKYYKTKIDTYIIMLIGFLSFFIGFISTECFKKRIKKVYSFKMNYKFFFFISGIVLAILLPRTVSNINDLLGGLNFNDIYIKNIGLEENEHPILKISKMLIVYPFIFSTIALGVSNTIFGKHKIKVFLITVLIVLLYVLQIGRRFALLYLIVGIFLAIILVFRKKIFKKKIMFSIFLVIILLIGGIIYVSKSRGLDSIVDSFYIYLTGAVQHFDIRIQSINANGTFTFGLSVLSGFLTPIFIGLKGVFGFEYPEFWNIALKLHDVSGYVEIGPGLLYNAFVTPFYSIYLDFGIIGIIIGMCIYGMLSSLIFHRINNSRSLRSFSIYILWIIGLLFSMFQFYFTDYPYLISFAYIYLLTRRTKK